MVRGKPLATDFANLQVVEAVRSLRVHLIGCHRSELRAMDIWRCSFLKEAYKNTLQLPENATIHDELLL
jgi:hypothetical protein